MWKRLNRKGNPNSGVDSTIYEDEYANSGFNYQGGLVDSNAVKRQPPVRPPRYSNPALPPIPFEPVQNQSAQPRNSYGRPASSVYSNTSPNLPDSKFPRNSLAASSVWEDEDVEISPPSSPDVGVPDRQSRRQAHASVGPTMSPVEELPDVSRMQLTRPGLQTKPRPGSNIPILRREKRRNQVAQGAANLLSKNQNNYGHGVKDKFSADPVYDPWTGELITGKSGGRQEVNLGELTSSKGVMNSNTTVMAAPIGQNSFGDRVRKFKDADMMSGARPDWKGSSGRSQPVAPMEDQLEILPLRIPRKSSLRSNSPRISDSGITTPVVPALRAGKAETSMVSPIASGYPAFTMRKIAPVQTGETHEGYQSYAVTSTSYTPQTSGANSRQYPSQPNSSKALSPPRDESRSKIERDFREAFKDTSLPGGASYEQPPSRFSVTTYATTTTSSTPRVSEDSIPPMPTPPKQSANLVVNRMRPKIGKSLDSTNQIARKAIGEPVFISMSSASRRNSKLLPKSPLEAQSTDLITSLEAQLQNLKQRRINLQRSIHQMTELMPTGPTARGMEAKRQADEKMKVELLREDLADVQREEHELGLRLHRAWKRRDQNAVYEPTGLWVRRVTG